MRTTDRGTDCGSSRNSYEHPLELGTPHGSRNYRVVLFDCGGLQRLQQGKSGVARIGMQHSGNRLQLLDATQY